MKYLLLLLAAVVSVALARQKGNDTSMMDGPPCARMSMKMEQITQSMLMKMKNFHEECIEFNDDYEVLNSMMKTFQRASKRLLTRAFNQCRRRNKRRWSNKNACRDHVELSVEEMVDQITNIRNATFTTTRNSSKGCLPGKTWFKPLHSNGTEIDIELLVRQHPRIQSCNNMTQSIDLLYEKVPRNPTAKPAELTFNVTFSATCMDKMQRMVKVKRLQCSPSDPSDVVYQVDGLKDICPREPMCEPTQFMMKKAGVLMAMAQNYNN